MYNTDFLEQIEEFQRYLGYLGCVDFRDTIEKGTKMAYIPPKNIEILPCHKAPNGEWVPDLVEGLEKEISSET